MPNDNVLDPTIHLDDKTLTVGHLRDELRKYPDATPVVLFTEGSRYPILGMNLMPPDITNVDRPVVELSGGWTSLEDY